MNIASILALVLYSCALLDLVALRIVLEPAVGKLQPDQCEVYARDLDSRLRQHRIESHLLAVYYWPDGKKEHLRGHAIVLYRVRQGDFWGMDNQLLFPVRVRDHRFNEEKGREFWTLTGGNPRQVTCVNPLPAEAK